MPYLHIFVYFAEELRDSPPRYSTARRFTDITVSEVSPPSQCYPFSGFKSFTLIPRNMFHVLFGFQFSLKKKKNWFKIWSVTFIIQYTSVTESRIDNTASWRCYHAWQLGDVLSSKARPSLLRGCFMSLLPDRKSVV